MVLSGDFVLFCQKYSKQEFLSDRIILFTRVYAMFVDVFALFSSE